jgi:hypothetical protein
MEKSGFTGHIDIDSLPEISTVDSKLLEKGVVYFKDFPTLPFFHYEIPFSWIVVFNTRPYLISGFDTVVGAVFVHLREIKEGCKLPWTAEFANLEICPKMETYASQMKLADCPAGTFNWLKSHEATKRVIERISKAAQ